MQAQGPLLSYRRRSAAGAKRLQWRWAGDHTELSYVAAGPDNPRSAVGRNLIDIRALRLSWKQRGPYDGRQDQRQSGDVRNLRADDILAGGLERDRIYLLEGNPGTGKTTAAMSFLMEGAERGERCLYTLSETEEELRGTARSHEWSLEGIDIFELVPPESLLDEQQQQSLLYSSDLELGETTRMIFEAVDRHQPKGVVIDSLSEIRLLAQGSLRYRRQVLALKHYFAKRGATVLRLDDLTTDINDKTVHSVAHGVIQLQELAPEYGAERRRVRVIKYRGRRFRGGYHYGSGAGLSGRVRTSAFRQGVDVLFWRSRL